MRHKGNTKITAKNMARTAKKGYKPSREAPSLELVGNYIQIHAMLGFSNLVLTHKEYMYKLFTANEAELKKAGFEVSTYEDCLVVAWDGL